MASNIRTIDDPQGQAEDWIELFNPLGVSIDIGGLYLTDDLDTPTQWRLPDYQLPAHGYVIVWADEDLDDDGIHAGFKLSASGESLALFDRDGSTLLDVVNFDKQKTDVSYGRYPDGSQNWVYMGTATPDGTNTSGYPGWVADTQFSHKRGFYGAPFEVSIHCATTDAEIFYTLDGSNPVGTDSQGPRERRYVNPIPITGTTCLRVIAVKDGWLASNVDTQTYLFLSQVIHQDNQPSGYPSTWYSTSADYAMDPDVANPYQDALIKGLQAIPTLSIALNMEDMFGAAAGIYTHPDSHGVSWERPASAELIYPGGQTGFQVDCGIRIQGGAFRGFGLTKKKSFRLLFKSQYGPSKLDYPLFGEDAVSSFDSIVLRAGANDGYTWSSARYTEQYLRDEFGRDLQRAAGHPSSHGMFVHLYINGLYWGLYNPVERPDGSFCASYMGGNKEEWDSVKTGFEVLGGSATAWNEFVSLSRNVSDTKTYQALQGNYPDGTRNPNVPIYLDAVNYIDYMLINIWGGNWDWPGKNFYFARRQGPESTGFKFFNWDFENTMGNNRDRSPLTMQAPRSYSGVGVPHGALLNNSDYRLDFADRVHRHFFNKGIMTPDFLVPRYSKLARQIEEAIVAESARWGDEHYHPPLNQADWLAERNWLLGTYLLERTAIVLNQLRSQGLYPSVEAPVFQIQGTYKHGGYVAGSDQLTMTAPDGMIWYTLDGSDPRDTEAPTVPTDTRVIVAEDAAKRVLVPTQPVAESWLVDPDFDDAGWTSGTGGVGYEMGFGYEDYFSIDMVGQMFGAQTTCYIRIPFNLTEQTRDQLLQTYLRMRYDDGFVAYLNGVEVARVNAPAELLSNSAATAQNPDSAAVLWQEFPLVVPDNVLRSGKNLLAIHGLNISSTSVDFLISAELHATLLANDEPEPGDILPERQVYQAAVSLPCSATVKARVQVGDQWSALNEAVFAVGPVAESLRITEIMYHPPVDDPNTEFIELSNIGPETINLNLVRFADGIDFCFAPFELAPGQYCVVVQDLQAFVQRYGSAVSVAGHYTGQLSNGGENVTLVDALGNTIQSVNYQDSWYPQTDGNGFSLISTGNAVDPNQKSAWLPSSQSGGSPGR